MKPKETKPDYRLFVTEASSKIFKDPFNPFRQIRIIHKKEVREINLGSIRKPNEKVLEIELIPIEESEDTDDKWTCNKNIRKNLG